MTVSKDDLSTEAQKLVELTTDERGGLRADVDLATILQQHPDLMKGLNEYTKWRDKTNENVETQEEQKPIGHSISDAIKDLKPRK